MKLRGRDISTTAPSDGEVLKWSSTSSAWEPSADNNSGGGGGGGSGHTIQDEGTDVSNARDYLNFVGELVRAADDGTNSTDITIDAKTAWLYG